MESARHPFPVSSTAPHCRRTKSESQGFSGLGSGPLCGIYGEEFAVKTLSRRLPPIHSCPGSYWGYVYALACQMVRSFHNCFQLAALFHKIYSRDSSPRRTLICIRVHVGAHRSCYSSSASAGATLLPLPWSEKGS